MPSPAQLAHRSPNAGSATPRSATVKSCPTVSTLAATPNRASSSSKNATVGLGKPRPGGELRAAGEDREPQREPRLVGKQGGPERRGDDSEPRLLWPGWGELLGKLWRVGHRCAHITARTACRWAPVGELNIVHTLASDVHRCCL